ncbi:MAG: redox-regulated ATPase YchF [Deltaproteobacteria bacterium]|nr:redox-regulated ATPase YchF [Deltaproteobacteria bacterium]
MKVGLIGHRGAGKTTIFNMLTGLQARVGGFGGREEVHLGVIKVPDGRVDRLSEIFKPKKTTYAEIRFTDFPPRQGDDNLKSNDALVTQMREVDAIALVLGDFEPGADPLKDLNDLLTEMILADMTVVENRRARLKKEKARPQEEALLERCAKALENEQGLRYAASYQDELKRRGLEGLPLAGKVEMEIAQLDERDRAAFLQEIGVSEPARDRFIQLSYRLLDLISFLTTGEDEVRAWTITRGTNARKAAGKIHSDIERGFIRAEVVAFEDFVALGSEAKCKEAGKLRLEGKDYVVADGDIIHFRFAV